MNILFNTVLFIIGIIIGSLWSIKSIEIPKNLDLKKKYYSNETLSKITYVLIGGVSSVILANTLNFNINDFDVVSLIIYIFAMLYMTTLVLVAGIDKNYLKIDKKILAFGIVSSIIYMLYLCAVDLASIYLNCVYFTIYMVLLIIDAFLLKKFAKDSYIVNMLMLLAIILVFTDLKTLIYTLEVAIIATGLYFIIQKSQKRKKKNKELKISEIPVGYFISASNIIILFTMKVLQNYLI